MKPPLSPVDQIRVGDFVPWFEAKTLAGTRHNLGVLGGRFIALCFVNDLRSAAIMQTLAEIVGSLGRFFNDDHVIFFSVMTAPPLVGAEQFAKASHAGMGFMMDYDGAITAQFDAVGSPRLIVLNPLLRVEKILKLGDDSTSSREVIDYLSKLPKVDDYMGVPQIAPALIIPNVFEPEFCDFLIGLYEKNGGQESGFLRDSEGKTKTIVDHKIKQRRDFFIEEADVREAIRERIVRRVVPTMERFFQYRATRMDRYLVSCYDVETGGHFARHRDNINFGAQHRRFAASFNLNDDYEGCGLRFPEFGRRVYSAPRGGAIAFSCGALHEVLPITRGARYAFIPFFYGEDDAALRLKNNSNLHDGEGLYTGDRDKLFP